MKITRMCSRLLELGEVYAMKRFRRFVSRRDFACLSERVMLLCPGGAADPETLQDAALQAMKKPLPCRDAAEIIPLRDGGAALHMDGGLYVMADRAEDVAALSDRVALIALARQAWQSGQVLAICTGKTPDVEIGIDQVRTRFTAGGAA